MLCRMGESLYTRHTDDIVEEYYQAVSIEDSPGREELIVVGL
jgi:hypothetical protein